MKIPILFISTYDFNISKAIQKYDGKHKVYWLQLWPVKNLSNLIENYPELVIINPTHLITNDDHYNIANEISHISKNWWSLFGLDASGPEWHIDELKISQIFSYELEQILTNILFQTLSVVRAIEKYQPEELFFIEPETNSSIDGLNWIEVFSNFRLYDLFKGYSISCTKIEIQKSRVSRKKDLIERITLVLSGSYKMIRFVRRLTSTLIKSKPTLTPESILISSSDRCLQVLSQTPPYKQSVIIVKNKNVEIVPRVKLLTENENYSLFHGVSLQPFIKLWLSYSENQFFSLKNLYEQTTKLIAGQSPLIYLTVNIANSTEIVKMWTYHQSGVRTVLACEGLGQPDSNLDVVINSVIHPEINVERWVSSKNFGKKFSNNGKPVRVSGYLDKAINKEYASQTLKSSNTITYALSIVNPLTRRAIIGEEIFEMLVSINNVSSAVSSFSGYTLNLRLHPGDRANIPIYKQQIDEAAKFRISIDEDLNKIIDDSALVIIYDTSVGLEALLRRKNVICYNYTNRDTYITSIYEYINHDPAKGAAMLMATNESELKDCINELLPYSNNIKPSPGLEYVLENARSDYNAVEVVKDLLN